MQKKNLSVKRSYRETIYRITISAVFLSLALVTKTFTTFNIPIFGAGGMKVGFSGIFTTFPAFLFGPLYGGIVSAASDFLGTIIKPDGAYIPWITVVAFAGGFIKGAMWKLLTEKAVVRLRTVIVVLLAAVGLSGAVFHVSLNSSGVMNGFVAYQTSLPTRGQLEEREISPISGVITELAKYNNDVITLTSAPKGDMVLPAYAVIDGYSSKITKIGKGAFPAIETEAKIYIPSSYTSIDSDAFSDISGYTVVSEAGRAAEKYALDKGIKFELSENIEKNSLELSSSELSSGGFSFKSSDTYRKYLAGYINLATLGLEVTAFAGLVIIAVDAIFGKKRKNENPEIDTDSKNAAPYFKIFISIFVSGLFVTTVNTEILRYFIPAWSGRAFIILWIPRLIEEMLVRIFQAYIISILYGIYINRIHSKRRAQ